VTLLARHLDVYKSLGKNKVRYVVIGGIACINYGVPRNTLDLDIWVEANIQNINRLLNALKGLKFGTAHLTSAEEILKNEITVFDDYLRLDVFTFLKGLKFEAAWEKRVVRKIDGARINFISLSDLIKSKKLYKRKIDREDLEMLSRVKAQHK